MKFLIILLSILFITSCSTYNAIKQNASDAYEWTKDILKTPLMVLKLFQSNDKENYISHATGDGNIPSRDANKKGLKRIMTVGGVYGTRNYTVKDLRSKRKRP